MPERQDASKEENTFPEIHRRLPLGPYRSSSDPGTNCMPSPRAIRTRSPEATGEGLLQAAPFQFGLIGVNILPLHQPGVELSTVRSDRWPANRQLNRCVAGGIRFAIYVFAHPVFVVVPTEVGTKDVMRQTNSFQAKRRF